MSTYNLTKNLQTWLHECSFPPKQTWKKIVRSAVSKLHQTNRNIRMINNNDFYRFQSIIQNQNPYVSSGLFRLNQSKSLFVYLYASLYSLSSVTDSLYLQTMQHRVPWHFFNISVLARRPVTYKCTYILVQGSDHQLFRGTPLCRPVCYDKWW